MNLPRPLTFVPIAGAVARILQAGTQRGAKQMAAKARKRLPDYTAATETIQIPTRFGPARAVVYRPDGASDSAPVHINLHGGGYVLTLTDNDDPVCRILAATSGSVVINVDYVVAPQHRFPDPPEQVHEIAEWVAEHGDEFGWDGQSLTIGGQSAGGGLAAAASRLAWERGGPRISLQALHYPPLDLALGVRNKRSPIAKPMLRPWMGDVFDTSYIPDVAQRTDRLASPAADTDTTDLSGIAPAVIVTAEHDILRDEAARYAERLDAVGALVELRDVPGVDHSYDAHRDDLCEEIYRFLGDHIARAHA